MPLIVLHRALFGASCYFFSSLFKEGIWIRASKVDFTFMFLNLFMLYNRHFVGLSNQKTYTLLFSCCQFLQLYVNCHECAFYQWFLIVNQPYQNIILMMYYIVPIIFFSIFNQTREISYYFIVLIIGLYFRIQFCVITQRSAVRSRISFQHLVRHHQLRNTHFSNCF